MENKVLKAKFGSDKTPLYLGELSIPCYVDRKSTRLNSSHPPESRMPSSA